MIWIIGGFFTSLGHWKGLAPAGGDPGPEAGLDGDRGIIPVGLVGLKG